MGEWPNLVQTGNKDGLDFPFNKYRFIHGILAEVALDEVNLACARAFVASPQTRLVRHLYLGGWDYEKAGSYDPGKDPIPADSRYPGSIIMPRWPYFENLRLFQVGWTSDENYGDYCGFSCHLRGDFVVALVKRMPPLEELYLFADGIPTGDLFRLKSLNHLRVLQIYHCWEYPLEVLARNPAFANLTHLLLHPKALGDWTDHDGPYITFEGTCALLHSPHLTRLTHLHCA